MNKKSHKNVCDNLLKSYVKSFSVPKDNALSVHVIVYKMWNLSFQ